MQTFEQLVCSCLNEGIINPSDYVDLDGIMNLLKSMCASEYWDKFLILKPEYSKYGHMGDSNKLLLTDINILNIKISIYLRPVSFDFFYYCYLKKRSPGTMGFWSRKTKKIALTVPVMWHSSYSDSGADYYTPEEVKKQFAKDLIEKDKLKEVLKYLFGVLKVKNTLGHEIVHSVETIKRSLKGHKDTFNYSKDYEGIDRNYEKYITSKQKNLGKLPIEFNPELWELINLVKNGTTSKEKYLEYLKSGGNANLMPKEWSGVETKNTSHSQFLQAISKKSPKLKKILFSKLAQEIQKL